MQEMTDDLPEDGPISVPLLEVKSSWTCTVSMSTAEEAVTQSKQIQNICDVIVKSMLMLGAGKTPDVGEYELSSCLSSSSPTLTLL